MAYLDDVGNLHVDGQDFGPQTAIVSDDGEYEFFYTVLAADIPALMRVLGADHAGDRARDLETVLRSRVVPVAFFRW